VGSSGRPDAEQEPLDPAGLLQVSRLAGKLHGDPTLAIERARKSAVYRTTFTIDQRRAILAVQPDERMHEARRTAGQRVLDVTGNLKAAQKLLGHASISTTADVYTDWDLDQLAETMREVVEENERIVPPGD
jgi:integrase